MLPMPRPASTPDQGAAPEEKWWRRAACAGMPTEAFYPGVHSNTAFDAARRACATCPVLEPCATDMAGDTWGFWANTSPAERATTTRRIVRRWTATDDALVASPLSDEAVAARTGRTLNAVRLRRSRLRAATGSQPRARRRPRRDAA